MSTVEETSTQKDRRVVYIVITVALVLLLIICLVFYRPAESNQQAQDKANQLIAALQKAGVRAVPSQEQIVARARRRRGGDLQGSRQRAA